MSNIPPGRRAVTSKTSLHRSLTHKDESGITPSLIYMIEFDQADSLFIQGGMYCFICVGFIIMLVILHVRLKRRSR
jgi:hypothetical protein